MDYPEAIRNYLEADYAMQRRPFCFRVDANFRLRDWWGKGGRHGFSQLQEGEDMSARAPYLVGHLGETPEKLPFITSQGRTAEVHILPDDALHYVVVMDASAEHDFHQQRQQVANELRLLHATREKLIEQQRVLIGDLVEAKTELDHRRNEAERANERRSQFFAMMSHEFRTPLSSIINYADLALEDDTSIEDVRKSAEAISRAARHMNRLVDTVLDEARLEAGQMVLTEAPFDLYALLDDLATIMAPLAAEKQLAFGIYADDDVPKILNADDACLRQILINLLGNAIKFTVTGGVRVDVHWDNGNLQAIVIDTGPGIAAVDQERVFEAFERASEVRSDTAPGTGLGLTITLGLARLMRGSIDMESKPGSGCRISVTVPAPLATESQQEESAFPEPDLENQAPRPTTIIVCDDDADLLALAEYYLLRAGYGVLLARDGKEAVEKALAYAPDLVLMDINTPRLSGSEAAAQLRAQGFSAPIIALTASDIRKLEGDTFAACLRKPIQMPRLLAAIRSHITDC